MSLMDYLNPMNNPLSGLGAMGYLMGGGQQQAPPVAPPPPIQPQSPGFQFQADPFGGKAMPADPFGGKGAPDPVGFGMGGGGSLRGFRSQPLNY